MPENGSISSWYLKRLGPESHEIFRLKYGENIVGRTESADIFVQSIFSSRKHCIINVTDDNVVNLKDCGTNGTFVNKNSYKNVSVALYENDAIGIGCTTDVFEEKKYNIYRLKRDELDNEQVIEILDDDSTDFNFSIVEDIKNEAIEFEDFCSNLEESMIKNIKLEEKDPLEDDIIVLSESEDEKEKADDNEIIVLDLDDENENVKISNNKIVQIEKEVEKDNHDLNIEDEDEDDDDVILTNWAMKLSQNISHDIEIDKVNHDYNLRLIDDELNDFAEDIKKEILESTHSVLEDVEVHTDEIEVEVDSKPKIDEILKLNDEIKNQISELNKIEKEPKSKLDDEVEKLCNVSKKVDLINTKDSSKPESKESKHKKDHKHKHEKHRSSSKEKDRDRSRSKSKEKHRSSYKEKNRDKSRSKSKEKHRSSSKEEDRERSRSKSKEKRKHDSKHRKSTEARPKHSNDKISKKTSSKDSKPETSTKTSKVLLTRRTSVLFVRESPIPPKDKKISENKLSLPQVMQPEPSTSKGRKRLRSPSSSSDTDNDFNSSKSCKIENNKKDTLAKNSKWLSKDKHCTLVIDALHMPPRKSICRGISFKTSNKIVCDSPTSNLKCKQKRVILNEKNERYLDEMKKKFKSGSSSSKSKTITGQDKNDIKETRKLKLKELASTRQSKAGEDEPKVLNVPKVKLTESNRGAFLTNDLPKVIPKRRNSRCASVAVRMSLNESTENEKIIAERNAELISNRRSSLRSSTNKNIVNNTENSTALNDRKDSTKSVLLKEDVGFLKEDIVIRKGPRKRVSKSISEYKEKPCTVYKTTDEALNEPHQESTIEKNIDKTNIVNEFALNSKEVSSTTVDIELNVENSQLIASYQNIIKKCFIGELKSILKKTKNTKEKKTKSVRFKDGHEIHYFEFDNPNPNKPLLKVSHSLIKESLLSARMNRALQNKQINDSLDKFRLVEKPTHVPHNLVEAVEAIQEKNHDLHPYHDILSDIISWNPDWMNKDLMVIIPSIIGKIPLLPMMHKFDHIDDYLRVIIPLMKIELWEQIRMCQLKKSYVAFIRHICVGVQKGTGLRNIHTAEFTNLEGAKELRPGTLLLIQFEKFKFFAYASKKEYLKQQDKMVAMVTFETLSSPVSNSLGHSQKISVTLVTYIRPEVAGFEAAIDLNLSPLRDNILNPLHKPPLALQKDSSYQNDNLNDIQSSILIHTYNQCLNKHSPNLVLIEGPPGTGKSHLISNLVSHLIYANSKIDFRILICSASNAAIDTILEKLIVVREQHKRNGKRGLRMVRFGVREKMTDSAKRYALETLLEQNVAMFNRNRQRQHRVDDQLIRFMTGEKIFLEEKIRNIQTSGRCTGVAMDQLREHRDKLRKIDSIIEGAGGDEKMLQHYGQKTEQNLMLNAQVVCTTLTSCINLMRFVKKYDICIIDEATQCTEPWTSVPLQFGINSLILIGDNKQLPATVISQCAKENGLAKSLFSRIQGCFESTDHNPIISLNVQYRMHPEICAFPNNYFYDGNLKSADSTINPAFPLKPYSIIQLEFFQLNQRPNHPNQPSSIQNEEEAKFIGNLVYEIEKILQKKYSIGIITPYQMQRNVILNQLNSKKISHVNVNTIDSYQGQERDVIILSTARTSGIGFLGHPQRLNVALTRAKHCLIICGNFISLRNIPVWKSLLTDASDRSLICNFTTNSEIDSIMQMIKK